MQPRLLRPRTRTANLPRCLRDLSYGLHGRGPRTPVQLAPERQDVALFSLLLAFLPSQLLLSNQTVSAAAVYPPILVTLLLLLP